MVLAPQRGTNGAPWPPSPQFPCIQPAHPQQDGTGVASRTCWEPLAQLQGDFSCFSQCRGLVSPRLAWVQGCQGRALRGATGSDIVAVLHKLPSGSSDSPCVSICLLGAVRRGRVRSSSISSCVHMSFLVSTWLLSSLVSACPRMHVLKPSPEGPAGGTQSGSQVRLHQLGPVSPKVPQPPNGIYQERVLLSS